MSDLVFCILPRLHLDATLTSIYFHWFRTMCWSCGHCLIFWCLDSLEQRNNFRHSMVNQFYRAVMPSHHQKNKKQVCHHLFSHHHFHLFLHRLHRHHHHDGDDKGKVDKAVMRKKNLMMVKFKKVMITTQWGWRRKDITFTDIFVSPSFSSHCPGSYK